MIELFLLGAFVLSQCTRLMDGLMDILLVACTRGIQCSAKNTGLPVYFSHHKVRLLSGNGLDSK